MKKIILALLILVNVPAFAQNVGIGTNTPLSKLHVAGTIRSDTLIGVGVRSLFAAPNGRIYDSLVVPSALSWEINGNANITPARFLGTTNANDVIFKTNNIERARILANGFIGVSTANPSVLFSNSNLHAGDQAGLGTQIIRGMDWNANDIGYTASFYNSGTTPSSNGALIKINNTTANSKALTVNSGAIGTGNDLLTVLGNGYTGILTNTPSEVLEIANNGQLSLRAAAGTRDPGDLLFKNGNGSNKARVYSHPSLDKGLMMNGDGSGATHVYLDSTGHLGIGAIPGAQLEVQYTTNTTSDPIARFSRAGTGAIGWTALFSGAAPGDWNGLVRAGDKSMIFTNDSDPLVAAASGLVIGPWSGVGNPYHFSGIRIQENGNVGIGASLPNNRLEITATTANSSGLRFTNLTAASPTVTSNGKALSVDASGDVVLVPASGGNAWELLGNAGTSAGTNFLGTTDAQDLVFKTNNTEKVRITTGGQMGIGTAAPNGSAILQIVSNTQGVMFPTMTSAQRQAIASPAVGLMVYDATANILMSYNGTRWQEVGGDPIGSIEAFHKNMAATPALPWGWVECNGQVLSDPESPYNGQTMPSLNATGKFLRGSMVSGTLQNEDIGAHTHAGTTAAAGNHNHGGSTGSVNSTNGRVVPWDDNLASNKMNAANTGQLLNTPAGGGGLPWDGLATVGNFLTTIDQLDHTHAISADGNHTHTFTTSANTGTETRPTNMSVVWIIRVK